MRKIYCFVEYETEVLGKLIAQYDKDSEIHIYSSVIGSCEGKLFFCFGYLLSLFWESEEKSFFVTDIKEVFILVEKLCSSLFEEIHFINQGVDQGFKEKLNFSELMDYSCKILQTDAEKYIMEILLKAVNDSDLQSLYKISESIYSNIMNIEDWKKRAYWIYMGKLILAMQEAGNLSVSEAYKLLIVSLLMRLEHSAERTNYYLECIMQSEWCQESQYYFIWNQFKYINLRNFAETDEVTRQLLDNIYAESYQGYLHKNREKIQKLSRKERKKDKVLVLAIQYLDGRHAPTRTVMERCRMLKKIGKEVYLINTIEQYTAKGYVPLYGVTSGTVYKKYMQLQEITLNDEKVWFRQLSERMPIEERFGVLIDWIKEIKPYYILSIGSGSMLADLCGNVVPCASMALAFSTFPHTISCMKILGRSLQKHELETEELKNVIESRFTFELKPQKAYFSREQYQIPADRFVLVVVGIRLDYEITADFLNVLNAVCNNGCYVVFAGTYNTYENMKRENVSLAQNSTFIGYCDDMLALMEICDLYVNPKRLGGGFSVIEAFTKGIPGVYLQNGDVYTAGGDEFSVRDFSEMEQMIQRYKEDEEFYRIMSDKAKKRAQLMTSSLEAMRDLDEKIVEKVEKEFW